MLIDDLDDAILARIFAIAQSTAASHSPRLRTYKHLLAIAAVCRKWRRLMHTHLHSTLIMEYRPKRVATPFIAATDTPIVSGRSADKQKRSIGGGVWASRAYIRKSKANGSAAFQQQQQIGNANRRPAEWASNISVLALQATQPMLATKLRIQAFVDSADYSMLIDTLRNDGFEQHKWTNVSTIEFVDFAAVPTPSTQLQQQHLQQVLQAASALELSYAGVTRLIAEHMPGVEDISSSTWDMSASSRCLATHLVRQYGTALRVWNAQIISGGISANQPRIGSNLTVLHIQTAQLELLGKASILAEQLQTLTLSHAPPFFSWQPFASSIAEPSKLDFALLTALTIDYEKDNVASDTHRDDATRSSKSPYVTMGIDPRRISFPRLAALTIRRVPYTYISAWSMFLDAPLKKLHVAGKHAHVRYIDVRLLKTIDCVDFHLYLSTHAQGKFTSLVKTLLAAHSNMRSAWLRHSEVFPLSVPQTAGWTNLPVKQGYFSRIHELVRVHAKEYPQMLTLELVDHISMQMKPALTH
ncbi:hypothetical protein GGI15_002182 [Coemansia interrupta]|uniref:Uncharacterized protein n=1 Tax=Coemansia interrupta TaxID=1126814 RepID=A0A9W8HF71_9FUNG|nr:hypothetical protein GGI15_002182 [Coemansia interrupta]